MASKHRRYPTVQQSGKMDICLWCDGVCDEDEVALLEKANSQRMTVSLYLSAPKKKVKLTMLVLTSNTYMEISTQNLNLGYGHDL